MKKYLLPTIVLGFLLSGCSFYGQSLTQDNSSSSVNNFQGQAVLDLSNQGLDKIPDNVFKQTNLEELNVSGNNISGAIQAEVRHLGKLKILNLSNNLMTGVPAEVGQLKNLEVLDLSNNELTGLPYELGNLKNLKKIDLSGNSYSEHDLDIIIEGLPVDVVIIR